MTETPVGAQVSLAREKRDSIRIEGTWQPIRLRLIQPPSTIPFFTYAPDDMIVETRAENAGEAHYFIANFGGLRNDDAFLLMFVFPAGTAEQDAITAARKFRDTRSRPGYVVTTDLRRHGARFYYIAEHYPTEYGDGFGPRSRRVQDEWQWLD